MDFFAQFFTWLDSQLTANILTYTAKVAQAIEPAAVTVATIYVMLWGFMQANGSIQEPLWTGIKRILTMIILFGVGIKLWLYNEVVVNTFYTAPTELAATIVGATNTVSKLDVIWTDGQLLAQNLLEKGGVLDGNFTYYVMGFLVYIIIGLTVIFAAFLLALSKIALVVIIALGPIFIVLLLFDATKRFFEAWVAQMANYALITVLTILVSSLLLNVLSSYANSAALSGTTITIAEAVRVLVGSVLILLVMRQIMSIAAGLGSGVALASFGMVSGAISWGLSTGQRKGYDLGRGVMDGLKNEQRSRWESLTRGSGNMLGQGLRKLGNRTGGSGGTLVPRGQAIPAAAKAANKY